MNLGEIIKVSTANGLLSMSNGIVYIPIYIFSYIIALTLTRTLKLEEYYKWIFTTILVAIPTYMLKDDLDKLFLWLSFPINFGAFFLAQKTSKEPFLIFMSFIGFSALFYFIFGVISGLVKPSKGIF